MLGVKLSDVVAIQQVCFERVDTLAAALDIRDLGQAKTIPYVATPFEYFRPKLNDNDMAYSRMEALVRDMATMHSLQLSLSELCRENELVTAMRESARILFGLGRIAFLFVQGNRSSLSGADVCGQSDLFQHIEIGLDNAQSLAAAVVLRKQPASTFDENLGSVSLLDIRIARALKSDGVLYIPMCVRGNSIGIMACGMSAAQYARIRPRLAWMTGFADLAAECVETWRELRRRDQKLETAVTSRFGQRPARLYMKPETRSAS